MGGDWFETIAEAERRAEKRLPRSVALAVRAGSERGLTLADNVAAFGELGFAPHMAGLSAKREQATVVMGQEISMPVLISPTGVQAIHPDGELAVARAAAARGTAMGLSSFASKPIEEIVAANPQTFLQVYWSGTREKMVQRLHRAKAAGAVGLIVTLDWSFVHARDWGSPFIPERIDRKAVLHYAPEVLRRPRWLAQWAKTKTLPDLSVPNWAGPGEPAPTFFGAYGEWMMTPPPTWDDVAWLCSQWEGPLVVKGITHPDDARAAVQAGAAAISVSNHGGNNLDGTPAAIRALPGVAEAVGGEIEILFDGGIRRGSDVVKAVALGARAVMLGRAALWGLAANGQAGVANVLEIMRAGITETLNAIDVASVRDLTPHDLVVPPGFARTPNRQSGSWLPAEP